MGVNKNPNLMGMDSTHQVKSVNKLKFRSTGLKHFKIEYKK